MAVALRDALRGARMASGAGELADLGLRELGEHEAHRLAHDVGMLAVSILPAASPTIMLLWSAP